MKHARAEERLEPDEARQARGALDYSALIGTWVNTNSDSRSIIKIVITPDGDSVKIRAFGACAPSPCDWGEVKGAVFADDVRSREGTNFSAVYDFGFMQAQLQSFIRQGVLVVASFNRFTDDSGRSNYFFKEFFYRVEEDDSSRAE